MSKKKSSDIIGYRTCDLPACSAVPQPTPPPRVPGHIHRTAYDMIILKKVCHNAVAVKFGVNLILVVSLSLMIGKNCFVVNPFVVRSHWFCHLAVLWSLTCWTISLLGILSKDMSSFLAASFASLSANSFP